MSDQEDQKPRKPVRRIQSDIAARIRRIRQVRQWTQEEMAQHIGVGKMAISYWENGLRRPSGTAQIIIDLLERATPEVASAQKPTEPVRIAYGQGPKNAKAAREAARDATAGGNENGNPPTASGEGGSLTASGEGTPTASPDPASEDKPKPRRKKTEAGE